MADLGTLLEAMPEPLAWLDTEGRLLAGNAALRRLLGPAGAAAPGSDLGLLVAAEDRATFAALLADPTTAPVTLRPADPAAPATARWAAERLGGFAGGVLLRLRDRSTEQRAAARAETAQRLETVGRLAGGIAHDFNNLLAIILAGCEAARIEPLPRQAETELGQVEAAARRGADLVRQLLAFARQQPLQPRLLDLNGLIGTTTPMLARLLGRGVRLESLPSFGPAWVRVDPGQIDQILLNLGVNARDAMGGAGRLSIRVAPARFAAAYGGVPAGDWVVLTVADSGPGIPAEVLPRIFEPFFTTRPDKGGTGLGLATVQGIVAQSGGHITVASPPGEGTRFQIYLPAAPAPEAVERAAPAIEAVARVAPALEAMQAATPAPAATTAAKADAAPIWLVEDEAPLRRLAAMMLQRAGHAVTAFEDAEAALEAAEAGAGPPTVLVTDVAMPGADGLALAERLRARWPALPVLVLSGYAERLGGEAVAGPALGFLAKPFSAVDLEGALGRLLG